jgi:hypothetical protein
VSDKTIRRLFNAMQGHAGSWVLLPGNHDAALAESVWTANPENPERCARRQALLKLALEDRLVPVDGIDRHARPPLLVTAP